MANRKCIVCGKPTEGSVGRTGIVWPNVCQPCKDDADGAVVEDLRRMMDVAHMLENLPAASEVAPEELVYNRRLARPRGDN
jgi:hypothetical protein